MKAMMIERVGDRGTDSFTVKDHAFTISANPMSDRMQLVVEVDNIRYFPIGRERTEEEKKRRHLFGDKGAKFSKSKRMCILKSGVVGSITTFATKDCLICEVYE